VFIVGEFNSGTHGSYPIIGPYCLNIPICRDKIMHVSEVLEITVVGLMEVSTTQAEAILTYAQDIEMLVSLYFFKGLVSLGQLPGSLVLSNVPLLI